MTSTPVRRGRSAFSAGPVCDAVRRRPKKPGGPSRLAASRGGYSRVFRGTAGTGRQVWCAINSAVPEGAAPTVQTHARPVRGVRERSVMPSGAGDCGGAFHVKRPSQADSSAVGGTATLCLQGAGAGAADIALRRHSRRLGKGVACSFTQYCCALRVRRRSWAFSPGAAMTWDRLKSGEKVSEGRMRGSQDAYAAGILPLTPALSPTSKPERVDNRQWGRGRLQR